MKIHGIDNLDDEQFVIDEINTIAPDNAKREAAINNDLAQNESNRAEPSRATDSAPDNSAVETSLSEPELTSGDAVERLIDSDPDVLDNSDVVSDPSVSGGVTDEATSKNPEESQTGPSAFDQWAAKQNEKRKGNPITLDNFPYGVGKKLSEAKTEREVATTVYEYNSALKKAEEEANKNASGATNLTGLGALTAEVLRPLGALSEIYKKNRDAVAAVLTKGRESATIAALSKESDQAISRFDRAADTLNEHMNLVVKAGGMTEADLIKAEKLSTAMIDSSRNLMDVAGEDPLLKSDPEKNQLFQEQLEAHQLKMQESVKRVADAPLQDDGDIELKKKKEKMMEQLEKRMEEIRKMVQRLIERLKKMLGMDSAEGSAPSA